MKTIKTLRKRTYDKSAKRLGGPKIVLSYDPLDAAETMHKFLNQLIEWTLNGQIRSRQASVCRAILATNLDVEGYGQVAKKIDEIEELLDGSRNLLKRAKLEEPASRQIVEHLTESEQVELSKMILRHEELVARPKSEQGQPRIQRETRVNHRMSATRILPHLA